MELSGSSLVLVADGARARLFSEGRRGGPLTEVTDRLGDLAATGHSHDPHAAARQSVHLASPHERDEMDFLKRLSERMEAVVRPEGDVELILIAPPRALGVLRAELSPGLASRVRASDPHERIEETADDLRLVIDRLRLEA